MRNLITLLAIVVFASVASAQISLDINSFATPATVDALSPIAADTYVTNELNFNCTSDWLSGVIEVIPTGGGIYQHAVGGITTAAPMGTLMAVYAGLQYDTYVSNGVIDELVSTAAAGDPGWDYSAIVFDASKLAITWYTSDTDDTGILKLAQVTLEDTCQGTWRASVTASPSGGPRVDVIGGTIVDGVMVPEPATMSLLAIGGLGLLIRRKR